MLWLWAANRYAAADAAGTGLGLSGAPPATRALWAEVWARRRDWLRGWRPA